MLRSAFIRAAALALLLGLCLPAIAPAQDDTFQPEAELQRLADMPDGYRKVQQYFYFAEMSLRAGNRENARRAYNGALATYAGLDGNNRALAVAYAANSSLGLAAATHLEFRDAPLRLITYPTDSAARMDLLVRAREEYRSVSDVGYARATFESLYLRAHLLNEWETDDARSAVEQLIASEEQDSLMLVTAIRHAQLSRQLVERSGDEYRRILSLEDSLGLAGGTGDEDVSRWTTNTRRNAESLDSLVARLTAREEALQALYAERQARLWMAEAEPLLWRRAEELEQQDAGLADPFFDFVLKEALVHQGYQPFMRGPEGFEQAHTRATAGAVPATTDEWAARRAAWADDMAGRDAAIERRLAMDGVRQLARVPANMDTIIQRITAVSDSLPDGWATLLSGVPGAPDVQFPEIPSLGGLTEFQFAMGLGQEVVDRVIQYRNRMQAVEREISTFRDLVADFRERTSELSADDVPPVVQRYARLENSLEAGKRLLVDTLTIRVLAQVDLAQARTQEAPAAEGASASEFVSTAADELRATANECRSLAQRYEREADVLGRRPPAEAKREAAGYLREFASLLDERVSDLSTPRSPVNGG